MIIGIFRAGLTFGGGPRSSGGGNKWGGIVGGGRSGMTKESPSRCEEISFAIILTCFLACLVSRNFLRMVM